MIIFLRTSSNVGAFGIVPSGTIGSSFLPVVNAVTRSSAARVPPSTPARSIPWIDSDVTYFCFWSSGTVSSVTRSM